MTNARENLGRGPVPPDPDSGEGMTGPRSASSKGSRSKHDKQLPIWQEMILLLGIALVLAIVIKAFFMQAFYIPSGSMSETLVLNDRILVEKVSFWGDGEPKRGDIVVFSDPGGWLDSSEVRTATNPVSKALEVFGLYPTGGHLVKRVIGVEGDTVRCCDKQGRVLVNGVPLNEKSYLAKGVKPSMIDFEVTVPEDHIWVQGDNRGNSADSRVHIGQPGGGFIPLGDVVGRVFMVVWPVDHAKMVERPATFESLPSD